MTKTNKATHEAYKTELFMPIIKSTEGKYIAVLSDDSVDRDDEKCSKGCIEKFNSDDGYIAGLLNHDNDVLNLVCEWTNKRVVEIDGHTAFVAEPKFYKSNPKAKIIQGMLDEGAKPGISIGAIVKNYEEIGGMRVFTELELLEASFVGIPSNRHGRAMAVAKSYNDKKKLEATKMDKEFTQKDLDSQLTKKADEMTADFNKKLESKDAEIATLGKSLEDSQKEVKEAKLEATAGNKKAEELGKKVTDGEKSLEEAKKKVTDTEKLVKEAGKVAIEKQKYADLSGEKDGNVSEDDVDKALAEGKLPIMRG